MNMKMKVLKISWMLVVILTCNLFFASCFSEDNPVSEKQQSEAVFQKQLDEALIWAQVYGPSTQAVAEALWHYVTMERRRLLITRPVRAPSVNAVPTTPSPSN